jgi:hypothetical protein
MGMMVILSCSSVDDSCKNTKDGEATSSLRITMNFLSLLISSFNLAVDRWMRR